MARPRDQFRRSDVTFWGMAAAISCALALLSANLSVLLPPEMFGSLHGTLNHLLLTDRIWLKRLTGTGGEPDRLDAILHDDRKELLRARLAEDARLKHVIASYAETDLTRAVSYRTTSGKPYSQTLQDILLHLFNHQAHHRGQAHACCSIVTGREPPTLDLLAFQRGVPAPTLA